MNVDSSSAQSAQPAVSDEARAHPRYKEYLRYRAAYVSQRVVALPFESWLRRREEYERARAVVFEVTPGQEIEAGWYVNCFFPRCDEPEQFGPYTRESQARDVERWFLKK